MKRFSLTIVAPTSAAWGSWSEKIKQVQDFYKPVCLLDIKVKFTGLTIPFEKHPQLNKDPNAAPIWTVDRAWYDANISREDTDFVCLVVPNETHPGKVTVMGLMTGKDVGAWELTVYGNETDKLYILGSDKGNSLGWFIIHELAHAFYAMLGKRDVTHSYFNQKDAENPAVVWDPAKVLQDFTFPELPPEPPKTALQQAIDLLKAVLAILTGSGNTNEAKEIAQVIDILEHSPTPPKPDRLTLFCTAIKEHEGYFPPSPAYPTGSRAYRNKNPGNVKWVSGMALATGKDSGGFAIFATYEDGFEFLKRMVRNAATGKSWVYTPTMTILQFFEKYAPSSDNNNPRRYAEAVAARCGLSVTAQLRQVVE